MGLFRLIRKLILFNPSCGAMTRHKCPSDSHFRRNLLTQNYKYVLRGANSLKKRRSVLSNTSDVKKMFLKNENQV